MAGFLARGLLNQLLPVGAPTLSVDGSPVLSRGGSTAAIFIAGTNTHFAPGATLTAGSGVAVSGLVIVDAQSMMANLVASPSAVPGPRSLVVTTGSEEAVLPNGVMVQ
jgi:hypothetical protein